MSRQTLSLTVVHLSTQINPKMMEEGQDNFVGRLQLELLVQKLFSRILDSLHQCPLYMRQLCRMLYEDMRYDHPDYIHRVPGNLIFLRFIVRYTHDTLDSETTRHARHAHLW